jgi:CRP/FNR family transcriptional regulator, cyclic AMP receptor protein
VIVLAFGHNRGVSRRGETAYPFVRRLTEEKPDMAETVEKARLGNLEALGDATQLAGRIHGLIQYSPLFENFNLAEIEALSHFMLVFRTDAGLEIIREGEAGDFMVLLIEGSIEVFKQDRHNASRLIAVISPGQSFGEMSMIDGEPRFASCVAAESCLVAVLSRENLARIILEQPTLGAKILMELVLMLSQRLRQTSTKLMTYMDRELGLT